MRLSKKQTKKIFTELNSQITPTDTLVDLNKIDKVMVTSLNCNIGYLKSTLDDNPVANIDIYKDCLINKTIKYPLEPSTPYSIFKNLSKNDAKKGILYEMKLLTHYKDLFLAKKSFHIPEDMVMEFLFMVRDYYSLGKDYLPKAKKNKVKTIYKFLKISLKHM